jgi:hypothetical protein
MANPVDRIVLDVPLFIRLMEFAREDAKTDLILHRVSENAQKMHSDGVEVLTMKQYDSLVDGGTEVSKVIAQLISNKAKEPKQ